MKIRSSDLLLAIGLAVIAAVGVNSGNVRSVPLALIAVVLACLTFVFHRRSPLIPALTLLVTNVALGATTPGDFPPDTVGIPMLFGIFLVARSVERPAIWVAGPLTLALTVLGHVVTPDGDLADFWPLLLWGGPWAAGRLVHGVSASATQRIRDAEGARDRAASEAATAERDRIARELHDVVGHAVSVMVVRAGGQRLRLATTDPEAAEAFGDIEHAGRGALTELREMLKVLGQADAAAGHQDPLLGDGVHALIDRMRGAGLVVDVEEYAVPDDVPTGVALATHRVVQESLTNALRHGTGPVSLAVAPGESGLHLRVVNAIGPAQSSQGSGRGVAGMRERVRLLGGTLSAGVEGGRWAVDVTLPLGGGR